MGAFDEIYRSNAWGFGSGHGSLPRVTRGYRRFIEAFLRENDVRQVVDLGCGDWQFSRLIDWGSAAYVGLDIVPAVVEANRRKYGRPGIRFEVVQTGALELPAGDLLIVKDVLQHMRTPDIHAFISHVLPRYRHALITNCVHPRESVNADIEEGGFRPLDLRMPPYNLAGAVVHAFEGSKVYSLAARRFYPAWKKQVLLVSQADVRPAA